MSWKQEAKAYPMTAAAKFAVAAIIRFGTNASEYILEFVGEVEDQEAEEFWQQFNTLEEVLDDFAVYLRAIKED